MYDFHKYRINKRKLSTGNGIAYIDEGAGDKTIVFIHGLATYANSWRMNIDFLKEHYRCIAVDLPGNGYSDKGNLKYGIRYFADSVFELIQGLQLDNVILVGHSMGGQICIELAAAHPDCYEALILCAPAGFETFTSFESTIYKAGIQFFDFFSSEEQSLRNVIQTSFYKFPKEVNNMLQELVQLMNEQSASQYRKMVEACIHGMMEEQVFNKLSLIDKPVLVIFGNDDALIPNKLIHPTSTQNIAEKGVAELEDAELIMIPKCGHFVQIEKAPMVNNYIKEFIEKKL